ncbi:response regulator [Maritimibacter sp. HL-12]|uniref:response regulator n=1 Tax=Maritimibacter sp. HL-12 TaxID=1162418 RepID=UPI000A1CE98B|nr:response regulator [Maritimibacter sp. HL-12]
MAQDDEHDIYKRIAADLPYLRRYARALTGNQASGDRFATATLEAILADPDFLIRDMRPRVALFRAFDRIWTSTGAHIADAGGDTLEARAQRLLEPLTPRSREALLLRTIEELRPDEIAEVMQITVGEAEELVATALREMQGVVRGSVMIIEDEMLIAMDIEAIVKDMGHQITGVARTRDQAVALAEKVRPDLILADIQLADNSSGIGAINDILSQTGDLPVIFITAFPERLLTGERLEPAFLITKPYTEEQVRSAVSQAMFFSSTEPLFG